MNIDVSPDGKTLVFDLLGDLYLLPMNGGLAKPLTKGRDWDMAPRYSLDGESVYFVSDRRRYKDIWQVHIADGSVRQVTDSPGDIEGAINWSHDKKSLIVGRTDPTTDNIETVLHVADPYSGQLRPIEVVGPFSDMNTFERFRDWPISTYSGAGDPEGNVYFADTAFDLELRRPVVALYKFNSKNQTRTLLTRTDADASEFKPQLSNDGAQLAYFRQYGNRLTELRIRDLNSGNDRKLLELSDADDASYAATHDSWPNYAFTPNDQYIVFWQAGKIHRVGVGDGTSDIIPFRVEVEREVWKRVEPDIQKINDVGEAQIVRWPSISPDGRKIIFAAIGCVWLMDDNTGAVRRLTGGSDLEYMPNLSPDGRLVAYVSYAQTEEDYGPARLMIASVDGTMPPREVLTMERSHILLPRWSPDSSKIALIRESTEPSEKTPLIGDIEFGWTDAEVGRFNAVGTAPVSGAYAMNFNFSRYVGFDENSENLIFSYPISRNEAELAMAGLDGGDSRVLAVGKSTRQIVPAPNLGHLAIVDLIGNVAVIPFYKADMPAELDPTSGTARKISNGAGYYTNWNSGSQLTYGLAQNFYRYDLGEGKLAKRRIKIAFGKTPVDTPVAFIGARLITLSGEIGAGQIIENGAMLIRGQRITAVASGAAFAIPKDAYVIDVTGKTIMPGLIDTHYHRIGGRGSSSGYRFPNDGFQDQSAIAYGVTSAWEPGGVASDGTPATADLQAAGRILGPRWSHAAMGSVKNPSDILTSYYNAQMEVRHRKEIGAGTIKEYMMPMRIQRQWLSTAANASRVGIVSHIDNFEDTMTLVVDGFTGGDHPYIPAPLYKDVQELLRQTGYIWTPNILITPGTIGADADKARYYWREVLQKRPNELEKLIATTKKRGDVSEPSVPFELHRVSRVAKGAADAAKAGASVGVSAHNMPASGLHREMWYLNKGGLPAEDVLRAATMTNAEKIGLQKEVGSLEVGKIADFLILDDNPLEDIINTLSIKYTVQGGIIYDAVNAEKVDPKMLH